MLPNVCFLPVCTKECSGFFIIIILLRSWVINKPGFCECVENRSNNSSSKQNKKNSGHPSVNIGKWETCAKI